MHGASVGRGEGVSVESKPLVPSSPSPSRSRIIGLFAEYCLDTATAAEPDLAIHQPTPWPSMIRPFIVPFILALAVLPAPAAPPQAPPPRVGLDPSLADWTPRPALGYAEPWEQAIEANWVDGRFRQMNTGPFLNCTMRYPFGKGGAVRVQGDGGETGREGEAGAVFDRATMRLSAAWTGGYLNHSDRRFGLMNTPTPKGEMVFALPTGPGWADPGGKWEATTKPFTSPLDPKWAKYRGMYVHGDRVVFSYTVGKCEVLDSPTIATGRLNPVSGSLPSGDRADQRC